MIQLNELRLGNYLNDCQFKKTTKVFIGVLEEIENGMNFYEPIPLTEDWLARFGFRKHRSDTRMWIKGCLTLKTNQKGYFFKWYESREYIKYVHQLQNLYFALTWNELKLKE